MTPDTAPTAIEVTLEGGTAAATPNETKSRILNMGSPGLGGVRPFLLRRLEIFGMRGLWFIYFVLFVLKASGGVMWVDLIC